MKKFFKILAKILLVLIACLLIFFILRYFHKLQITMESIDKKLSIIGSKTESIDDSISNIKSTTDDISSTTQDIQYNTQDISDQVVQ